MTYRTSRFQLYRYINGYIGKILTLTPFIKSFSIYKVISISIHISQIDVLFFVFYEYL